MAAEETSTSRDSFSDIVLTGSVLARETPIEKPSSITDGNFDGPSKQHSLAFSLQQPAAAKSFNSAHFDTRKRHRGEAIQELPRQRQRALSRDTTVEYIGNAHRTSNGDIMKPSPSQFSEEGILVSPRQKGNSVLKWIKNVPWRLEDGIKADYVMSRTACALYISLRYHLLHSEYLHRRIKELGSDFTLRVLLCIVDLEDNERPLKELNRLAISNDMTLVLSWSSQEAARYLETYKSYECKSATMIMEKQETDFIPLLTNALTAIRSINRTDVITLAATFGSLQKIMSATIEQLALCPGLGEKKVRRIYEAFHEACRHQSETSTPSSVHEGESSAIFLSQRSDHI